MRSTIQREGRRTPLEEGSETARDSGGLLSPALSSKGGEGEEGAPREGEGSGNPKAEGRRPKAERRPKPEGRSHAQLNPPNTLNDAKGADLMRVPASR